MQAKHPVIPKNTSLLKRISYWWNLLLLYLNYERKYYELIIRFVSILVSITFKNSKVVLIIWWMRFILTKWREIDLHIWPLVQYRTFIAQNNSYQTNQLMNLFFWYKCTQHISPLSKLYPSVNCIVLHIKLKSNMVWGSGPRCDRSQLGCIRHAPSL